MENQEDLENCSQESIYTSNARRWLLIIVALGLLIRFIAAYVQPAFIDEGYVYYLTKTGIENTIYTLKIDAHPPTFNIIMYPLIMRTANIFLLRLPCVCLSAVTILLAFALLRRFMEETASLTLTALYASSLGIVITDAQLRTYGPLTLSLTAMWIGLLDVYKYGCPYPGIFQRHPRWRWALLWLCGCSGAAWHYLGILSLAACCLSVLFLPRSARMRTLLCLVCGALPSSLWLIWSRMTAGLSNDPPPAGMSLFHFNHIYYIPACLLNLNINILKPLCANMLLNSELQYALNQFVFPLITLPLWAVLILGWRNLAKERAWEAAFLGVNLMLPPLLLLGACVLGKLGYSQTRYSLPMSIPFFILLFNGLKEANRPFWQKLFLSINTALLLLLPFCPFLWNQSWKDTRAYLDSIRRPKDIIGICPAYTSHCFAMDYDPEHISFIFDKDYKVGMIQQPSPDKTPIFLLDPSMRGSELLRDLRGFRLILIMCQERVYKENGALLNWLSQYYTLAGEHHFVSVWDWADVNTYVLEPKTANKYLPADKAN